MELTIISLILSLCLIEDQNALLKFIEAIFSSRLILDNTHALSRSIWRNFSFFEKKIYQPRGYIARVVAHPPSNDAPAELA